MTSRPLLAVALFVACSRASSGGATATRKPEPPPLPVEAADLEDAYFQREMLADRDYGDRTLAISGVVTTVEDGYDRRVRVWLGSSAYFEAGRGRDQTIPDPGIACPMGGDAPTEPALAEKAKALRPGSRVTLTCRNGTGQHTEVMGVDVWSPTLYDCWF